MSGRTIFISVLWLCCGVAVCSEAALPDEAATTRESSRCVSEIHVAVNGNDSWDGSRTAPLASIEQAQTIVRKLRSQLSASSNTISVVLHEGTYFIEKPLIFTAEDSGSENAPVIYRAADGERPVISGGKKIAHTWTEGTGGVWTVEIPEVRSGDWYFRHLYINGESRPRARHPNQGFFRVAGFPDHTPNPTPGSYKRFGFQDGEISAAWKNPQDAFVVLYNYWTDYHLPIDFIDQKESIVTFSHPSKYPFLDGNKGSTNGARYVVENFIEVLDEPGEWYLDRSSGILSYWPKDGEDLSRAEVIAPVAPALIKMRGNASRRRPVEHVQFHGLAFEHTSFELPDGNVNFTQGASTVPGAVVLSGAQSVQFKNCRLRNLGGFAFEVRNGCKDNLFVANEISHVAGGGFQIRGASAKVPPLERTSRIVITDNVVAYYGETYASAVGILLMNADECVIAHNHVHHGFYTGISVGWRWGYARSISWNNKVEFNHIHDIGQHMLSDLGGIYTLGMSPGTLIRNNLIHGISAGLNYAFGIYCDEGTTHLICENNVVYDVESSPFHVNYGKGLWVRNNIFALGGGAQISLNHPEQHESVFFERNIVYWTNSDALFNEKWANVEPYNTEVPWKGKPNLSSSTGFFNWNLYFNPDLTRSQVLFSEGNWNDWRSLGKDQNSIYADPLFVNPEHGDFSIAPDSPAFKLGFQRINLENVGPR